MKYVECPICDLGGIAVSDHSRTAAATCSLCGFVLDQSGNALGSREFVKMLFDLAAEEGDIRKKWKYRDGQQLRVISKKNRAGARPKGVNQRR